MVQIYQIWRKLRESVIILRSFVRVIKFVRFAKQGIQTMSPEERLCPLGNILDYVQLILYILKTRNLPFHLDSLYCHPY